ncbi:MAG: UDP-glucose/GDP-mannose dehydrogenase family protein [Planctomycetota bacterium]|nr:MAG: UDP-glucose/GDP-mannose dehydrogenase family protein [Planctomycetota bacterium]
MQIAVVGTGYVGLVAGTCFAEMGNQVFCVDIDEAKIKRLRAGEIPIYEPGLEELVRSNVRDGRLLFTTSLQEAVETSRVAFIAVGTPPGEDGSADLSAVLAVAREIGRHANGPKLIVDKSTVPVGTAAKVKAIANEASEYPIEVVSNPEFLKEGAAIDDFMKPDRVVIGAESQEAFDIMDELYSPFVRTGKPIMHMDPASAELTKYAANAMLATRISFMNEIARLCDQVGANISLVRQGIGSDSRIGNSFLFPGIGYGGSCFPKDVKALMRTGKELGYTIQILDAVEAVNEAQKVLMLEKAVQVLGEDLSGLHFGVWGLAFKPKTDDMREAPSVPLIQGLLERGATVCACDPAATETAKAELGDRIEYTLDPYKAVEGADALFLCTEWNEFRRPDFDRLAELMKRRLIFDGRNIYSAKLMRDHQFERYGVGIPPVEVETAV